MEIIKPTAGSDHIYIYCGYVPRILVMRSLVEESSAKVRLCMVMDQGNCTAFRCGMIRNIFEEILKPETAAVRYCRGPHGQATCSGKMEVTMGDHTDIDEIYASTIILRPRVSAILKLRDSMANNYSSP